MEKVFSPDIFTNGDPNPASVPLYGLALLGWLKIAPLIKDIIGWQESLEDAGSDLAIHQKSRCVAKWLTGAMLLIVIHVAHHQRNLSDLSLQIIQCLQALIHKSGLKDQIPWRITHQSHLWHENKFCTLIESLPVGTDNTFCVRREIAHRAVDLRQSDLHL